MWTLRCFITCVHRCSLSWVELSWCGGGAGKLWINITSAVWQLATPCLILGVGFWGQAIQWRHSRDRRSIVDSGREPHDGCKSNERRYSMLYSYVAQDRRTAAVIVMSSFVISPLDRCNSLTVGLPNLISFLHQALNVAAWVIYLVLSPVHW